MNVLASLGFWVTFLVVLSILFAGLLLFERGKRNRPKQRRGVRPGEPASRFISDFRLEDGIHVHEVSSDPQTQAKAFLPPNHKD
jgi:hypothetical protein